MSFFFKSIFFFVLFIFSAQGEAVSVYLSPEKALIDSQLHLSITGLNPNEKINIVAECKDSDGVTWKSNSKFRADFLGEIDLSKISPIEGEYSSIDPMGLIWSMLPEAKEAQCYYNSGACLDVSIKIFRSSELIFKKRLKRWIKDPEVKVIKLQENFTGELYYKDSSVKKTAVIVMGGSNGGISRAKAQLLASHGYLALALGYFKAEGLPENLENISLEYVVSSVNWLKTQSQFSNISKVALFGTSRGGELALLVASYFPDDIDYVIANVPSSVANNGIPNRNASAWSYAGAPISFVRGLEDEKIKELISSNQIPFHEGSYLDPYEVTDVFLAQKEHYSSEFENAKIPVENIKASVLLISAEDDKMWPSKIYCEQIKDRVLNKQSEIKIVHKSYKNAGHGISFPFYPSANLPYYHPVAQKWFTLGGTMEGNAQANKNAWRNVLDFLKDE